MISKGANFGENGCSGTDTFGTDTMAETKFGDGAGLGATIVDCGVNFDGNVGWGEGGMIVVSIDFGAEIAGLISFVIVFTVFCVSLLKEIEGAVCFGSAMRVILSPIDWRR